MTRTWPVSSLRNHFPSLARGRCFRSELSVGGASATWAGIARLLLRLAEVPRTLTMGLSARDHFVTGIR